MRLALDYQWQNVGNNVIKRRMLSWWNREISALV